MEPDTETEPVADDLPTCAVCGASNGSIITLDDGTLYCSAHRGLATNHSSSAPAAVSDAVVPADLPLPHDDGRSVLSTDSASEAGATDALPWPMEPAVRMVASLCFEAALATFHEDQTYGDPPTGWAPPPANESPFMEAGVVLAIATLIEAAEIDREVIQQLADVFAGRAPTNEGQEHE